MKISTLLIALGGIVSPLYADVQVRGGYMDNLYNYLENTSVYEEGQEEGHAFWLPEHSLSLNGEWKFFFGETPEEIPTGFFAPDYNVRKWESIAVPGNWEMFGYGNKVFRNVHAPFKANPPYVPRELCHTSEPYASTCMVQNNDAESALTLLQNESEKT